MSFKDDVDAEHLGHLSRIKLSEDEKNHFDKSLKKILKYTSLLDEVDTVDVTPCTHVLETLSNVMRKDEEATLMDREIFFQNVPDHIGGMIKVPPVIHFEE